MDRKTRICVWIIILGLINFLVFLGMYVIIGGDAKNGQVWKDEHGKLRYLIQMRGAEAEAADPGKPPPMPATRPGDGDRPKSPMFVRIGSTNIYKTLSGTPYKDVGQALYIYSGVHSIFIWITVAAVLLAMLTLAKDQLVTAMADKVISGRAIIHVFAAVVICTTLMMTVLFLLDFIQQLRVR